MTNRPTTPRTVSGLGQTTAQTHPALPLSQQTYKLALDCVQCGLCLPACPTYLVTGHEADSPRGRIRIIKGLADGRAEPTRAMLNHLDLCLDCRGCESACPSNVVYHKLIEETRATLADPVIVNRFKQTFFGNRRVLFNQIIQALTIHVLPYPQRLRWALTPAAILQRLRLWRWILRGPGCRLLADRLLSMMQLLPEGLATWDPKHWRIALWSHPPKQRYRTNAPNGQRKATAALFRGCVGSVLFPQVDRHSVSLLQLAGCDVIVPKTQHCCGAIHHHNGHLDEARALARRNIDAFLTGYSEAAKIPWVVNHIAGCGAMLKQYVDLLRDDPVYANRARIFSGQVRDISEVLVDLKLPQPGHGLPNTGTTVTYHDACHLLHAQHIADQPRQLLASIPDLEIRPLGDSHLCCGAAGSYNLTQPEMAAELGKRKIRQIQKTGAQVCATGNVGCAMHLQCQAHRLGLDLKILHPISLLHEAHFGCDRQFPSPNRRTV